MCYIIIRFSNQCFAEQSYLFTSHFTLIFSLETTILEKREERIEKSEENKRNDNLLSKIVVSIWLRNRDSNPNKQSQSLPCCRYTIPQYFLAQPLVRRLFYHRFRQKSRL